MVLFLVSFFFSFGFYHWVLWLGMSRHSYLVLDIVYKKVIDASDNVNFHHKTVTMFFSGCKKWELIILLHLGIESSLDSVSI